MRWATFAKGLQRTARIGAYLIALLLAVNWAACALDSLGRPFFDIGRPAVGDVIISIVNVFSLAPQSALLFALFLVCLKLMVGALLLATFMCAIYERLRWGRCDAGCRAAGLRARERRLRVPRSDPWRRDAQRDHRRADALPDRERTCDLRPRLSRTRRATGPDAIAGLRDDSRRLIYLFRKSRTASV